MTNQLNGGAVGKASDLWSTGCKVDFRPCTAGLVLRWVTVLCVRKPSPYVISHYKSTQPSIPPGEGKSSTSLTGWGKGGMCSLVEWQVRLCDPTRQVTPRSSEMEFH